MMTEIVLACDIMTGQIPKQYEQEWESEESILVLEKILREMGYKVHRTNSPFQFLELVNQFHGRFDSLVVWNLVEGYTSPNREAYIPATCEFLGIPHTGSGASVQCLTLNKHWTKLVCKQLEIPTPMGYLVDFWPQKPELHFPLFVKPNGEGSGLGIFAENRIQSLLEWDTLVPKLLDQFSSILVEEYLEGPELTVGMVQKEGDWIVLPPAWISYPDLVYGEWVKTKSSMPEELTKIEDKNLIVKLEAYALTFAKAIGASGYLRLDFKFGRDTVCFLEANGTPGFSPFYSTFPKLWEFTGKNFKDLVSIVINTSLYEYKSKERFRYGKAFH